MADDRDAGGRVRIDSYCDAVLHLLDKNGLRDLHLRDAAAILRVSPRTLERRLSAEGFGFSELVTTFRWYEVAGALVDGASVGRAVELSGYRTGSHFAVAFRSKFGVSPNEFRDAARHDRISWGFVDASDEDDEDKMEFDPRFVRHVDACHAVLERMSPFGREMFHELVESEGPPQWALIRKD